MTALPIGHREWVKRHSFTRSQIIALLLATAAVSAKPVKPHGLMAAPQRAGRLIQECKAAAVFSQIFACLPTGVRLHFLQSGLAMVPVNQARLMCVDLEDSNAC